MVTKEYNIFVNEKSSEESYMHFLKQYEKSLRRIGHAEQIYDLNDCAVIINMLDEEQIKNRQTNNLTLIGKESNLKKTINEIKIKFLLEEITN